MPVQSPTSPLTRVDTYINGVLSGKTVASEWVILQLKNHVEDLKNGHDRGLRFNPDRAEHVIEFIETYIKGTQDDYKGQPFILEPWAATMLSILYGWEFAGTGQRRFRVAYCEIARGNLKSLIASALCLYDLVCTQGANVYSASSAKDTAKVVFDTSVAMVQEDDELRALITSYRDNLHIPDSHSKYEPCSAEAKTLFKASRPSFAVLDELHLHPNKDVWVAFWTALNKRPGSLLFAITNSGWDRNSICYKQREYSIKVLQRVVPDDTWFSWICGLSENDDWEDEKNWIKANPSLGHAVSLDGLRKIAVKAKEDPSLLNEFLRFYMCIWTEGHSVYMPLEWWDACKDLLNPDALLGRECFAGLDLSSTDDITALVLLFPPYGDDKKWSVLPHFFLPADNITKRAKTDRVPYDVWERDGWFTLTPGNYIDTAFIRAKLNELQGKYKILEVDYDKTLSADLTPQLQDDGFTMVPVHPGDISQTPPLKQLKLLVQKQDIVHGNNPVLRWMCSNLVVRVGATGLMKPDKEKSREKIDGICALLDALSRAIVVPIKPKPASFVPFFLN